MVDIGMPQETGDGTVSLLSYAFLYLICVSRTVPKLNMRILPRAVVLMVLGLSPHLELDRFFRILFRAAFLFRMCYVYYVMVVLS